MTVRLAEQPAIKILQQFLMEGEERQGSPLRLFAQMTPKAVNVPGFNGAHYTVSEIRADVIFQAAGIAVTGAWRKAAFSGMEKEDLFHELPIGAASLPVPVFRVPNQIFCRRRPHIARDMRVDIRR